MPLPAKTQPESYAPFYDLGQDNDETPSITQSKSSLADSPHPKTKTIREARYATEDITEVASLYLCKSFFFKIEKIKKSKTLISHRSEKP